MDNKKVTVGMKVCVNDLPDSIVYTVAEKNGFNVRLTYEIDDGSTVDGGVIDTSYLKKPTKLQLQNGGKG